MSDDPAHQLNRAACQAEFTYGISVKAIKIQDTGKGAKSVSEDLEAVLRKIETWHQGSIAGYRIMCWDAGGYWDGCEWDGQHARFFAIRETDEAAAERKLLAHNLRP
jgi:hypothetical protein